MPNKELQEILSARFEGHTQTTNESVWSAIESQLDGEKSDRAGFWFWIFNGIAATVLVGLLFQSNISLESGSSLSQSQLAKGTVKQEAKVEYDSNQYEVSKEENSVLTQSSSSESTTGSIQARTIIPADIKVGKVSNSNEMNIALIDKKPSTNKVDKLPPTRKKEENGSTYSQDSKTLAKTEINQEITQQLPIIDLYSTNPRSGLEIHTSMSPNSLNKQKRSFLKYLPIHLGAEFTYMNSARTETNAGIVVDTGYTFLNSELSNNRHFEFSLFSQFDFTQRFSASVGIGYSSSNYSIPDSQSNVAFSSTGLTLSDQRIITIPIQAKFAFFQKNRFALSAGLTFQGEFGRNSHTYIEQVLSVSGNLPTSQLQAEESIITVATHRIQQFAFEPFLQLSVGITPRISTFANLGYRSYFGQAKLGITSPNKLSFINADVGINFRIY
jgi:hypothetical protein